MKTINKKMKIIGLVSLFFIGFSNFMWLDVTRFKWFGTIPQMVVVRYQINPNFLPKNGLTQTQQLNAIQNAANVWFEQGLSNFRFEINGQTSNATVQ